MKTNPEKRRHTFDAYHEARVSRREDYVRRALELLGRGRYPTVTALAKDVAKLVSELERKSALDGEEPSKMAYTTLLRSGSKYKHMLLAHFDGSYEAVKSDEAAELEELRFHCVHIEHENEMLKNRLASLAQGRSISGASKAHDGEPHKEVIRMLIDFIDAIVDQAPDIFTLVDANNTNEEFPDPGMYGPYRLVADMDALERITELRKEIENGDK